MESSDLALELLQSMRLAGSELDTRLAQARSIDYWRSLAPGMSIGPDVPDDLANLGGLDPSAERASRDRFAREGYFRLESVVPVAVIGRMREAALAVSRAGWPPVFTWVYDEFWSVPRIGGVAKLVGECLGPGFRQTPDVWTHVVPGRRDAGGWPPHVDRASEDLRLTFWIPLSDATLEGGCMCLIPRHLMPAGIAGRFHERKSVDMPDVEALLQAARPLVAHPGTVLGWDARLVHWGSIRPADGDPRVSFALEFAGAGAPPEALAGSLAGGAAPLPSYPQRLTVIAQSIVLYRTREARAALFEPVAQRLLDAIA